MNTSIIISVYIYYWCTPDNIYTPHEYIKNVSVSIQDLVLAWQRFQPSALLAAQWRQGVMAMVDSAAWWWKPLGGYMNQRKTWDDEAILKFYVFFKCKNLFLVSYKTGDIDVNDPE